MKMRYEPSMTDNIHSFSHDTIFIHSCQKCGDDYEVGWETTRRWKRGYNESDPSRDYSKRHLCNLCIYQPMVPCQECNTEFRKELSQIKKSDNNFCSQSCAATYNNKHRKTGIRRSKAERYLEAALPFDDTQFNVRDLLPCGLELDVYIPSINLAIELNGPVHYEPIYGIEKYHDIIEKDKTKAQECQDLGIQLVIIDVNQSRFKDTKQILDNFIESLL